MKSAYRVFLALTLVSLCIIGGILGCAAQHSWLDQSEYISTPRSSGGIAPSHTEGTRLAADMAARGEELWIIQKPNPKVTPVATNKDETPGSGAMMAKVPSAAEPVAIPLKHTDVKASILGYIATVDVTQQYHNPYQTKIEAIYVFPLPHNAAINEFVMTIGERKIRGIIREREEAQKIYNEARSQGYVASLLTQERPNIFTQAVANIEPGKQIDVSIRYYHTLSYVDGWFEFVFPMVVGPRFNPPGNTDGVGAVGRGSGGISGQKTEVSYLRPGERSGHDISLSVEIDAGVSIENLKCRSHATVVKAMEGRTASLSLANDDRIPNKDFVLRYKVAGKSTKSAIFAQRDAKGGYFTMLLVPPETLSDIPRQPLEMVFTLDVSGSMSGRPIEQSKAAMRYALSHMDNRDTFQVIRFGDRADKLFDKPQPVSESNLRTALNWIDRTQAGSGTMMVEGIRASLNFPHDEGHLRFVSFLTDGFIGNEVDVLREIHGNLGPSRIFSFGVGSSPNRYLLEHMAKMGNGAAAFLGLSDSADEVMAALFERISHPALTDITIDGGSMNVKEVYPQRLPDLFVGRPVIISGRFSGNGDAIKIKGRIGGQIHEQTVTVNLADGPSHKALAPLWARAKIADLGDQSAWQPNNELPLQIKQLALEFGLMSPFTAFVAVDSSLRTTGDHGITVPVPVTVPDGVKYETTVQEKIGAKKD